MEYMYLSFKPVWLPAQKGAGKRLNTFLQKSLVLLILFLSGYHFVWAQKNGKDLVAKQKKGFNPSVHISRTIAAADIAQLKVESYLPVSYTLTNSNKAEIRIEITLDGNDLSADILEEIIAPKAKQVRIVLDKKNEGGYVKSGRVEIQIPQNMKVGMQLSEGRIVCSKAKLDLNLNLSQGDLLLDQFEGQIGVDVGNGSIRCVQSTIRGNLVLGSGQTRLQKTRGQFTLAAAGGILTVNAPGEPIELSTQKGQWDLACKQADISLKAREIQLNFSFMADKKVAGQEWTFHAESSIVNLSLPDEFSMDLNLDQNQTEAFLTSTPQPTGPQPITGPQQGKGKKMKLESEFALTPPSEKEITHQGKKMKVAQGRQLINGGGNKVAIHATDSEVNFRKIKTVTK